MKSDLQTIAFVFACAIIVALATFVFKQGMTCKYLVKNCTEKVSSSSVEVSVEHYTDTDSISYTESYQYYAKYTYIVNAEKYTHRDEISEELYTSIKEANVIDVIMYNPENAGQSYIEGNITPEGMNKRIGIGVAVYVVVALAIIIKLLQELSIINMKWW